MRRTAVLLLVPLLTLLGCGGDGEGDGVPTPDEVLACLRDEHGLQAEPAVPTLTGATDGIRVATPDSISSGDFLTINFFKTAEDATAASAGRDLVADTVALQYNNARFGLGGPKAAEQIRECVG